MITWDESEEPAMNRKASSALLVAALAGTLFALPSSAITSANPGDALTRVPTRQLDEVYVRSDADFKAYRKVIIDAPQVEMKKGWLRSVNATRGPSRWLVPDDVTNITDNAATSLTRVVNAAFVARGYEVVSAPDAGVLRVSARVTDLWVNAPDVASAYQQALFNVDAGEATLMLEVRDAATGKLLGQVIDRGTARQLSTRINRAFAVTNLFWFDALFSQWTANCMGGLQL
jgi:Protein of unknown function (DUF3313)